MHLLKPIISAASNAHYLLFVHTMSLVS